MCYLQFNHSEVFNVENAAHHPGWHPIGRQRSMRINIAKLICIARFSKYFNICENINQTKTLHCSGIIKDSNEKMGYRLKWTKFQ